MLGGAQRAFGVHRSAFGVRRWWGEAPERSSPMSRARDNALPNPMIRPETAPSRWSLVSLGRSTWHIKRTARHIFRPIFQYTHRTILNPGVSMGLSGASPHQSWVRIKATDDLSAPLETISSLRRADPRVMENVRTWKQNNKIRLNHRLSAQDVAEEEIQHKICWSISLTISEVCSNSWRSRSGRFCRSSER